MSIRVAWLTLIGLHTIPLIVGFLAGKPAGFATMFAIHVWLLTTIFLPRLTPWSPSVRRFRTERKQVCLTIDDGPTPDTGEFLSILESAGARAVFFLIGERVLANPELCRSIAAKGHVIGNHTHRHRAGWFWCYFPQAQRVEIDEATRAILENTEQRTRLFRAPVGFRNFFNPPILRELGMRDVGWTVRGYDGIDTNVERILKRIVDDLKPGAIILLHQGKPHHTELLRRLLAELKSGGWETTIPSELTE
jgi:peptidoglycan/xylan/chitin deacetylase (PgdA/CDA1 family)